MKSQTLTSSIGSLGKRIRAWLSGICSLSSSSLLSGELLIYPPEIVSLDGIQHFFAPVSNDRIAEYPRIRYQGTETVLIPWEELIDFLVDDLPIKAMLKLTWMLYQGEVEGAKISSPPCFGRVAPSENHLVLFFARGLTYRLYLRESYRQNGAKSTEENGRA